MNKPRGLKDLAELTEEEARQAKEAVNKLFSRPFKKTKAQRQMSEMDKLKNLIEAFKDVTYSFSGKAEITEEDWEAVRRDLRQVQQDIKEIKYRSQND